MEKKLKGHLISKVDSGSIGEELELEPGDCVLTINGNPIEDIFDYEYYVNSPSMLMTVRKADGEEWELDIENDYEDLGLTFENGLMSEYRSCSNKCIFCFIDQMPPGMRETLYFKDDDTRLSFLQGNYVTLTKISSGSSALNWLRSIFPSRPPIRSFAARCCTTVLQDNP